MGRWLQMIPQSPVTHNDFSAWWSLTWSAELTQWLAGQGSLQTITYIYIYKNRKIVPYWNCGEVSSIWSIGENGECFHNFLCVKKHDTKYSTFTLMGTNHHCCSKKNGISQIQECDECFIIPYNYSTPFPTVLLIFSCYNCQPNSVSLSEHLSWYPLKYLLYSFCTWLTSYRYGHFPWLCYITKGYPLIVAQW